MRGQTKIFKQLMDWNLDRFMVLLLNLPLSLITLFKPFTRKVKMTSSNSLKMFSNLFYIFLLENKSQDPMITTKKVNTLLKTTCCKISNYTKNYL